MPSASRNSSTAPSTTATHQSALRRPTSCATASRLGAISPPRGGSSYRFGGAMIPVRCMWLLSVGCAPYEHDPLPYGPSHPSHEVGRGSVSTRVSELRLYDYAASGNCYKVRLLLAQLGLRYERVPVDIFAGETMTAEYAARNPMQTVPVLETVAGSLPESNAILLYLAEGTPFLPGDAFERAQAVRWLIYEQTDVIPGIGGLRFRLQTQRLAPEDDEALRRRRAGEEVLRLLE